MPHPRTRCSAGEQHTRGGQHLHEKYREKSVRVGGDNDAIDLTICRDKKDMKTMKSERQKQHEADDIP